MVPIATRLACAQCGHQPAPGDDLAAWKHAEEVTAGEVDRALLLCPDCREDGKALAYDEGEPG